MAWIALFLAGILEVCWAVGLKYSDGFTRPVPTIFTLTTMAGSFWLLTIAMRSIPLGTAYAIWTGIGAIGAVMFGTIALGETLSLARIISIALVIAGIIGLKLFQPA